MHQDFHGLSFTVSKEPNESVEGGFSVHVTHVATVEETVEQKETYMKTIVEDTGKVDDENEPIMLRKQVPVERTVETVIQVDRPVKMGYFNIFADVDKRTLRAMVKNWLAHSSKVADVVEKHNAELQAKTVTA